MQHLTDQSARRFVVAGGLLGALSAVINASHGAMVCALCGALAGLVAVVSLVWAARAHTHTDSTQKKKRGEPS